jgi:hypothetical protein
MKDLTGKGIVMTKLLVGLLLSMLLPAGGDVVFAAGKNLKSPWSSGAGRQRRRRASGTG